MRETAPAPGEPAVSSPTAPITLTRAPSGRSHRAAAPSMAHSGPFASTDPRPCSTPRSTRTEMCPVTVSM